MVQLERGAAVGLGHHQRPPAPAPPAGRAERGAPARPPAGRADRGTRDRIGAGRAVRCGAIAGRRRAPPRPPRRAPPGWRLSARIAAGALSTNVAPAAPRLSASSPSAPEPANRSSTRAPSTRAPRMENSASRTRSEVGRVAPRRRRLQPAAAVAPRDHAHVGIIVPSRAPPAECATTRWRSEPRLRGRSTPSAWRIRTTSRQAAQAARHQHRTSTAVAATSPG